MLVEQDGLPCCIGLLQFVPIEIFAGIFPAFGRRTDLQAIVRVKENEIAVLAFYGKMSEIFGALAPVIGQ